MVFRLKFDVEKKRFLIAVSILVGTCIGAGVLGIPYVAAQSGFFVAIGYILILGFLILTVNLYLGEISLRTKGNHQLIGYAKRYLGRRGKRIMEFETVFGIYAALIAYSLGMGDSLSVLIFGDVSYGLHLGALVGFTMAGLLRGGLKSLKKFEKWGVFIILLLLIAIFIMFSGKLHLENLMSFNLTHVFLPFGIVLFALMSFHAIPEVKETLAKNEKIFKKVIITGTLVSVIFYMLFAFIVVGFSGSNTPEISTLTLGAVFILLGIFTMFTSYLVVGNALMDNFRFDERYSKNVSWFLAAIVPIALFLLTQFFKFFSFTKILSIGGVVAGGLTAILVLLMVKKSKEKGERIPEYSIPAKWWMIGVLLLIFLAGLIREIWMVIK